MQCIICSNIVDSVEYAMFKRMYRLLSSAHTPFVEEIKLKLPEVTLKTNPKCVDKFGDAIVCMNCLMDYMDKVYEEELDVSLYNAGT